MQMPGLVLLITGGVGGVLQGCLCFAGDVDPLRRSARVALFKKKTRMVNDSALAVERHACSVAQQQQVILPDLDITAGVGVGAGAVIHHAVALQPLHTALQRYIAGE